jgi:hypothetical protein
VSAPAPGPGGGGIRVPEYVIEIYITPQLRQRDPARPLTLLEALDTGRPAPKAAARDAPEPEAGT